MTSRRGHARTAGRRVKSGKRSSHLVIDASFVITSREKSAGQFVAGSRKSWNAFWPFINCGILISSKASSGPFGWIPDREVQPLCCGVS